MGFAMIGGVPFVHNDRNICCICFLVACMRL